jgi:hypothetical protein
VAEVQSGLERAEVYRLFGRIVLIAVLLCVSFSFGEYMIAPGGEYAFYSAERQSFAVASDRWFFQSPGMLPGIIVAVFLNGFFLSLVGIALAIVLASLLSFFRPLVKVARWSLGVRVSWIVLALIVACLLGLWQTIRTGLNPGICC